jgi:hypothetical protein
MNPPSPPPASRPSARWPGLLGWIALLAVLAVTGGLILFTRFMIYDDEGYVLWSVRGFCEGAPLYTGVYSQYGPLFFLFYRAVHALSGLAFDNDTARLLNLGYWLASATIAGVVAQHLCRRVAAGLVAAALTFVTLISNANEPFHPGALLALLVAAATALGARRIGRPGERHLGWIVALFATAACLVKINVGAFLFAALGTWLWLDSRRAGPRDLAGAGLVAAALLAAPLALMRDHLAEGPTRDTALVFACGGLALLVERGRDRRALFTGPDWTRAALASLALAAGVTGLLVLLGTHPADLLEGLLLAPLRHPGVYAFPPRFPAAAVLLAPLSLLGAIWLSRRANGPRTQTVLALAKLAAGLAFFAQGPGTLDETPLDRFAYYFGPSLAWLLVAPLGGEREQTTRQARWIAWIFLWQTLQAFPVAGSQVAWGSFLWVPLCVHGWFQASTHLAGVRVAPRHLAAGVAGLGAVVALGTSLRYGLVCLKDSAPLDLPGARWVRPPPDAAATLRIVSRNLRLHAGTVFSLPGMFSLNVWSEKPTPTRANVTHWFSLLDKTRQAEIAARLDADPTAIVVLQRDHLRILLDAGFQPRGTLHDHILAHFVPLARIDGYDFWGHPGRRLDFVETFSILPGGLAGVTEMLPRPPRRAILHAPGSPPIQLDFVLPAPVASNPDLEKNFFALPGLAATRLPPASRLVLLDAEGRELARLRPNLAPALTAAAPPAAN